MPNFPIFNLETVGVEMRKNPLLARETRASYAENISFDENTIKTRPSIRYSFTNLRGRFQGVGRYTPKRGLSSHTFGSGSSLPDSQLGLAVQGTVTLSTADPTTFEYGPAKTIGKAGNGYVNFESAENYFIVSGPDTYTFWFDGDKTCKTPGYKEDCVTDEAYDTFDNNKIEHWLPPYVSNLRYIHGRVHASVSATYDQPCEGPEVTETWVSDIVTKRGCLCSDDLLKMTEHALDTFGGPVTSPSRLGPTVALEVMPDQKNNGEGTLFDFRRAGLSEIDTMSAGRQTKANSDGSIETQGWDFKRLSNVRLNKVGAVGPRSTEELPADILYRSPLGVHLVTQTLGVGTYKDQFRNTFSHDVEPVLDCDDAKLLHGSAAGYWPRGHRFFATTGLVDNQSVSALPYARGAVVFNQGVTYSEDNTPRPTWEGVWRPDEGILAVHDFEYVGAYEVDAAYGWLVSDPNLQIYHGLFTENKTGYDERDGEQIAIPYKIVSDTFIPAGLSASSALRGGTLTAIACGKFDISVRKDETGDWEKVKSIDTEGALCYVDEDFGPSKGAATRFQFMIEGEGYIDLQNATAEVVADVKKTSGRRTVRKLSEHPENKEVFF